MATTTLLPGIATLMEAEPGTQALVIQMKRTLIRNLYKCFGVVLNMLPGRVCL